MKYSIRIAGGDWREVRVVDDSYSKLFMDGWQTNYLTFDTFDESLNQIVKVEIKREEN